MKLPGITGSASGQRRCIDDGKAVWLRQAGIGHVLSVGRKCVLGDPAFVPVKASVPEKRIRFSSAPATILFIAIQRLLALPIRFALRDSAHVRRAARAALLRRLAIAAPYRPAAVNDNLSAVLAELPAAGRRAFLVDYTGDCAGAATADANQRYRAADPDNPTFADGRAVSLLPPHPG